MVQVLDQKEMVVKDTKEIGHRSFVYAQVTQDKSQSKKSIINQMQEISDCSDRMRVLQERVNED